MNEFAGGFGNRLNGCPTMKESPQPPRQSDGVNESELVKDEIRLTQSRNRQEHMM